MVKTIIKRDGRKVPYEMSKIQDAVLLAGTSVNVDVQENIRIATEVAEKVDKKLNKEFTVRRSPTVEQIQDIVEAALVEVGHTAIAKEYILYRAERNRTREMKADLMKTFEDLTFKDAENVDIKRENGNIDANTAMGTMLKYGSESAKEFNHLYLLDRDVSEAHKSGDIHIHDLDFYALTETCIVANSDLVVKYQGKVMKIKAEDLEQFVDLSIVDEWKHPEDMYIWSKSDFTKIKGVVRHSSKDKKVLKIFCRGSDIEVTGEHLISVEQEDGSIVEVRADELKVGQQLIHDPYFSYGDRVLAIGPSEQYIVESIKEIDYVGSVYDLETENHHYAVNNIWVHNCLQIPLDKLFKGGFSTGHGYLREPNSIRSYAALTAIALQANQNEMHVDFTIFCRRACAS